MAAQEPPDPGAWTLADRLAVIPAILYPAGVIVLAEDRSTGDPRYVWYGLAIMAVAVALMWAVVYLAGRLPARATTATATPTDDERG
jgi:hypothetical protein